MTDSPELQQAVEDLGKAFEEFKSANDQALEQKAAKDYVDADLTERVNKLQAVIEEKSTIVEKAGETLKKSDERIEELETAMARSGPGAPDPKLEIELRAQACEMIRTEHYDTGHQLELDPSEVDDVDVKAMDLYNRHFSTYLRRDKDAFLRRMGGVNLETKLLSVDRDPGGGYWVKPEMSARIATIHRETSPVRQFATVETIGSDSLELIRDEDQAGFGWVAEQEDRPETTTPEIGKKTIHAHELYAEPRVTQKLLDDAGFNVENWLSQKVGERFGRAESTAHVVGTGVGQPRGFMTYPSGTASGQIEQINSGNANNVTADGLFDLIYSLKAPYLRNARYMAARLTIRDIRKLKDGQGRYIWEPNFQVGEPASILGYPMVQADDVAAVSAGNLAIAFGDFRTAYTIVDRMGIRVLRDPYTAKPFIKLYTTRRTGGDVVNFESLKIQVISA